MQVVWVGKEHCSTTWEPEEKIPQQIIADFEGNIKTAVVDCVASRVGHVSHTLFTSKNVLNSTVRPVVKEAEGYAYNTAQLSVALNMRNNNCSVCRAFKELSDDTLLQCNTEKDKQRLHDRSAGTTDLSQFNVN